MTQYKVLQPLLPMETTSTCLSVLRVTWVIKVPLVIKARKELMVLREIKVKKVLKALNGRLLLVYQLHRVEM